ncbi:flagellar hook-associated protein FlgK [Oceanimonas smirnovii]|uniref:flagellar hook-associated protein FlgK n=1 Tax=Oceanimonas smirnovii TaxID=264574 RepID=UPI00376FD88C
MAVDMYQTGVSGLLAAQSQLATTGHNIANVNTEGYNRQRVEQSTTNPINSGGMYIGTGTQVSGVTRLYQEYAFKDLLVNNTEQAGAVALHQRLSHLDQGLSSLGKAISGGMDEFYGALNALVDNPGDLGNRNIVISRAEDVANQYQRINDFISQEMNTASQEIDSRTDTINKITSAIAILNQEIQQSGANGAPNDLLDKRDQLIKELSSEVKVTTLKDEKTGAISVLLGGREPLVIGNQAYELQSRPGQPDSRERELHLVNPNKPDFATRLTSKELGGELGAVFNYRNNVLPESMSEIGKVAIAIADVFNKAQAQGVDIDGNPGQSFFNDINSAESRSNRFLNSNENVTGEVTITDINKLSGDEFTLKFNGSEYELTNLKTGAKESFTDMSTLNNNLESNHGINLSLTETPPGSLAAGDIMQIRPTRGGAGQLAVNLTDGRQIAASGVVNVAPGSDNQGTAQLEVTADNQAHLPAKNAPWIVSFDDSGNYTVDYTDAGGNQQSVTAAFDPNNPVITVEGLSVEVKGIPKPFDSFSIEHSAGTGNNTNAVAMADIKNGKWLDNGKSTLEQGLNSPIISVGSQTYNQRIRAETATAVYSQSLDRVQSTSGVNLDEEASNLLRFQQAYMASARVVSVASETMNTLLQIR